MKILVVSFFDDNFGDILIKICFKNLLKVVLKNLGINSNEYEIKEMHLKDIHYDWIEKSDLICFAGGGLFGLSYLNFYEYLNNIISEAEKKNIPVIFSSMGINNMDANEETETLFRNLLKNKCIKAVSVRENLELFKKYAGMDSNFKIELVCDPAVWSKYIYYNEFTKNKNNKKLIGINVVRGGLFKDNKKDWKLKEEFEYLNVLKKMIEDAGYDYLFYTNGSFLDNNSLHYYQEKFSIPNDKVFYPHTTKDLIKIISTFDLTAAIRMHSSIISYSFGIPSTNLLWNDKINFFYKNIGFEENVIRLSNDSSKETFEKLVSLNKMDYKVNTKYFMSIYNYLYNALSEIIKTKDKKNRYSFNQVKKELINQSQHNDEDIKDLRFKIEKGEKLYLARFKELKKIEKNLKEIKADFEKKEFELSEKKEEIQKQNKHIEDLEKKIENQKKIDNEKNEEIKKLKYRLNRYQNFFPIRIARKARRIILKSRKK